MIRRLSRLAAGLVLLVAAASAWTLAGAQEDDSAEKGAFTRYVEDTISTPDRQISLGSIDGALSSDVRISSITIADRTGVWLTINDVHLVWSRLALLRGRLDIDLLEASSIVVERPPVAADGPPAPAAGEPFALPELPVEILIDRLAVPEVVIGDQVLGERAQLAVDGSIALADGTLDTDVAIRRTDEKPGTLALTATYADADGLVLDLTLDEPPGGVLAGLIGIPDRPAVSFSIKGEGPLTDFSADIGLAVDGDTLLSGTTTLAQAGGGHRFVADLTGRLAPLFPAIYAPYFAGTSTLAIDATRAADGSIAVASAGIESGVARLDLSANLAPDGFPTAIDLTGTLTAADGSPVPVPGAGDTATIEAARFNIDFGGAAGSWTADFDLSGLTTATLTASAARIAGSGEATGLADPAARRVTADVTGALTGVAATDPELARALGDRFDVLARLDWAAGRPVDVEIAEIKNPNAAVHFAGSVDGLTLDGRIWLNAGDVAPFAGLAGQDLSGALTFDANGTVAAGTGAFDLAFDAVGEDLAVGIAEVDPLLRGETRLAGRAARTTEGLRFDGLTVTTPQLEARIDGGYDLARADLDLAAEIADIGVVLERASGPLSLTAGLQGSGTAPAIAAALTSPALTLDGRRLADARVSFEGVADTATAVVNGRIALSGSLDGVAVDGGAAIEDLGGGARRISDIAFSAAGTRVGGDLTISAAGLLDGALSISSPDLAQVAPLALVDASGAVNADIRLAAADGRQSADIVATLRRLAVDTVSVGEAAVDLAVDDLFGIPRADGRASATAIDLAGTRVERLEATASREGETTRFDVDATLEAGTLATAGALSATPDGYAVALDAFRLARGPDLAATLAEPVTLSVAGGTVTLPRTLVDFAGGGRIVAEGQAGETLDLALDVTDLPLALANAVEPDLAAAGTLAGNVRVEGPSTAPSVDFAVRARDVAAAPLRAAGVPALAVDATGRYENDAVTVDASASGGGLSLAAAGSVPVSDGDIDLRVVIDSLPLSLANTVDPSLGAAGTVAGTATVSGTVSAPRADFDLRATGVAAAPLRDAGVPPLAVTASGIYSGDAVTIDATAEGGGLQLTARGDVPLQGGRLDVAVRGGVPLSLADTALAVRGTRVSGTADVDLRIGGTLEAPRANGTIAIASATVTDPETATRLNGISARIRLDGDRATIENIRGVLGNRGSIAVSGTIGIAPGSGYPADIRVVIDNTRFADGRLVTADLSGRLDITGPLATDPLIAGRIFIDRAEIIVPETLPGSGASFLDVRHRLPPPNVERTLERVRRTLDSGPADGTSVAGPRVRITVDAPQEIFVRGRGIDAELGGSVRIAGPLSDVRPVGAFNMIRGRVAIIGQRINFDQGTVTLIGDLDPVLDFVATTRSDTISVSAQITGKASDPQIVLTSVPELPQDEVLARLLFGRGVSDLSPLQIASLAAAVAELAGAGGGPGILDQLRAATGLDDLEIVTDSEGNAAVQAGRYIGENIYLGVTAGPSGSANVSVNLDITDDLKARVEVGPSSGSKVGVFYETEY